MIDYRRLSRDEVEKIAEIDPREVGRLVYRCVDGEIVEEPETWERPRWSDAGTRGHVESAREILEQAGAVFGAFDERRLVGFATLLPELEPGLAQLQDMQVSRSRRRLGIAAHLVGEVLRGAREAGATRIYVSSCPSESAVGLYRSLGFELAEEVHPALYELEPEDIHMTLDL